MPPMAERTASAKDVTTATPRSSTASSGSASSTARWTRSRAERRLERHDRTGLGGRRMQIARNSGWRPHPDPGTGSPARCSSTPSAAPEGYFAAWQAASVHFTPGARTAWHTHPQGPDHLRHRGHRPPRSAGGARSRSSGPAIVCSSSPARTTGMGATPNGFMTHLAMQEVDDDGQPGAGGRARDRRYFGPSRRPRPESIRLRGSAGISRLQCAHTHSVLAAPPLREWEASALGTCVDSLDGALRAPLDPPPGQRWVNTNVRKQPQTRS